MMFEWCFIAIVSILILRWYTKANDPLQSLPQPSGSFIYGNAKQIQTDKVHQTVTKWAKQYGGLYKLRLLTTPVVVVTDPKLLYQVLVTDGPTFAGRPYPFALLAAVEHGSGIARVDYGEEVKGRRKVIHSFLKQFGAGLQKLEDVTVDAIGKMKQSLLESNEQPIDAKGILFSCVSDIMAVLILGELMDEKTMSEMIANFDTFVTLNNGRSAFFLNKFPFLRFFGNRAYKIALKINEQRRSYIGRWFKSQPENGLVNFIQSLDEEEKCRFHINTEAQQIMILWDFLIAGIVTTQISLLTLFNVLSQRKTIQNKLKVETKEVIGEGRYPMLKDRDKMPYHRATLLELSRFASIAPLGLGHKSLQDAALGNNLIPKGTQIWTNLWGLHHDEHLWDDPFGFHPERFLDEAGDLVPADHPNRKHLLAFGAGTRVCVAEVFAMNRMFLMLASILQTFTILPETTLEDQPSMDPRDMTIVSAILRPPVYKVRFEQD